MTSPNSAATRSADHLRPIASLRAACGRAHGRPRTAGPRAGRPPRPGGLGLAAGETLPLAAQRDAFASTMVVLRDPGEVFVLRHSMGTRPLRDESVSWVERIDSRTLEPLARSKALAGGPFWPGGLVAHANGSLYVVHGRYCHRLSADDSAPRLPRAPALAPLQLVRRAG